MKMHTLHMQWANMICLHYNYQLNVKWDSRTYVEEEVDEGVVATIGHGQPVHAEPDYVDVWVPAQCICSVLLIANIFSNIQ